MKHLNNEDNESVSKVKILLDTIFSLDLKRTKNCSIFDLRDEKNKYFVEVKKRNNEYHKYLTTMVGENKFIKAKEYYEKGYNILFCFHFNDGVYYYKYCDELLDIKLGGYNVKNRPVLKKYVYIPIDKLKRLEIK